MCAVFGVPAIHNCRQYQKYTGHISTLFRGRGLEGGGIACDSDIETGPWKNKQGQNYFQKQRFFPERSRFLIWVGN